MTTTGFETRDFGYWPVITAVKKPWFLSKRCVKVKNDHIRNISDFTLILTQSILWGKNFEICLNTEMCCILLEHYNTKH